MTYRILPTDLHPVADEATAFLRSEWGIAPSKIVVEREFHNEVAVPTLHAVDRDHYIVAIEVSNSPYPPQLDAMVLDCSRLMLPVKLYVAMPEQGTIPQKELQRAKDNGVGVLIVNSAGCKQFERALSLSLVGAQNRASEFPSKYRRDVSDAFTTFIQGDPSKACARVYDEIEAVGRRICVKATKKSWWKRGAPNPPDASNPKSPWKGIASFLTQYFDAGLANAPDLNGYLLTRVEGTVGHRNQSGHKPASLSALKKRDKDLRTRFEHGVSTLLELVKAAAPTRV